MDQNRAQMREEIQELISSAVSAEDQGLQKLIQDLYTDSKRDGDEAGIAYALYAQGMALLNGMSIRDALEKMEEARKHAVLAESKKTEIRTIFGIALCLLFQQNYEESLEQFLNYMRLYYEHEHEFDLKIYTALNNVGELFRHLGEYDTALQYYLEAQEVCGEKDPNFLLILKPNIANAYIKLRDPDQARRYLEETEALTAIAEGSQDDYMIRQTYGHLAHLEGDLEKADRLLNEALTFYRTLSIYTCIMEQNAVYEDLYEVYQERERWAKGEDLLLEAVNYSRENKFWLLHIHYLGLLARHFEESHEATKAYDTLRRFYKSQMKYDEIRRTRKIRNIELRIEMDQLKKEKTALHSIARLDRLTGIYNRRAMQEHFEQFLRGEFAMEGETIAGLLLDVDYFKEYNDHYGHLAGDQALIKIAKVLEELAESLGGSAYRYGGDEFLMMFENLSEASMVELTEALGGRIKELNIIHEAASGINCLSCSAGILLFNRNELISFEWVFKQMDELLYLAKRKGRNRVETKVIK
ncbi:hypothetical protein SANA_00600 [Gottschalkiaceae bacterium SANA]|nr:hypothetical protein SANA_00600 [Gottschalkiaceae bacterium SANA]